ncbi:MAG: InlB B-repeat-containing protein [Erysipelotrichaceae bacterium]
MKHVFHKISVVLLVLLIILTNSKFGTYIKANSEDIVVSSNVTYDENYHHASVELETMFDSKQIQLLEIKDPSGKLMDLTQLKWETTKNDDYKFTYRYKDIASKEKIQSNEVIVPVNKIKSDLKKVNPIKTDGKRNLSEGFNSLNIEHGAIIIDASGASVGGNKVVDFDKNKLTVLSGISENNKIEIKTDITILLDNVHSTKNSAETMKITNGANVKLLLKGNNEFQSNNGTALYVDNGTSLTIDSNKMSGSSDGLLTAISSENRITPAIGSDNPAGTGAIKILGGSIDASGCVGIGGMNLSTIDIQGGSVNATGLGNNGAGIGTYDGTCGTINISGGIIHATGGYAGAGIGHGATGNEGVINISGDANITALGGFEGAGIGTGQRSSKININITGNSVVRAIGGGNGGSDIGGGGQFPLINSTINISGGMITTGNKTGGHAIGDVFGTSSPGGIINITGGTFKVEEGFENRNLILGKKITISGVTFDYPNTAAGGINCGGNEVSDTINITDSTIHMLGSIVAYQNGVYKDVNITNSDIATGTSFSGNDIVMNGSTFTTKASITATNFTISGNSKITAEKLKATNATIVDSMLNLSADGQTTIQVTDLQVENSKLDLSNARDRQAFTIYANNSASIKNSEIITNFSKVSGGNAIGLYSKTISFEDSNYKGNGFIYVKDNGTFDMMNGHIKINNSADGLYGSNNGTFNIYGGYLDMERGIRMETKNGTVQPGTLNIGEFNGKLGNPVIFTSELLIPTQNINKGLIIFNENGEDSIKKHGKVYGQMELSQEIDDKGTVLIIPKDYTIDILDDLSVNSLMIPKDKTLVNNGKIVNEKNISVFGTLINTVTGEIFNENLTPNGKTRAIKKIGKGGEINVDPAAKITNQGVIYNELYIENIMKDGKPWLINNAIISAKMENGDIITSKPGEKTLYIKQGNANVLYNDLMGTNITSDLKYMNIDLDYFTLTYDEGYENRVNEIVHEKDLVKEPTNPIRLGYTFAGWFKDKGYKNIWNFEKDQLSTTTTLYAKWEKAVKPEPTKYTVNFDTQNKFVIDDLKGVEAGSKIRTPDTFDRIDFIVKDWYKDKDFKEKWDFNTDRINENTTLYAKVVTIYKVNFHFNGGVLKARSNAEMVLLEEENALISIKPIIKKEGFIFDGFYKDETFKEKWDFDKDRVTSHLDLYAKWIKANTDNPDTPNIPNIPNSPSKPSNKIPNTSDTTMPVLYLSIVGIIGGAYIIIFIRKKDKKKLDK